MNTLLEDVRREIVELHEFFSDWFNGNTNQDQLKPRFLSRLHSDFIFIPPEGVVLDADDISNAFAQGYGTNSDFKIQIRDVTIRHEMGNHILVTYTEWQAGAKLSGYENNARFTTVLMEKGKPFKWLHLQETWLPENVRRTGSFNFDV